MTVAVIKTKAEQALLQGFDAVSGVLPGAPWVADMRRKAIERLAETGLPHRRVEEWKYTDLRAALKDALPPAVTPNGRTAELPSSAVIAGEVGPELADLPALRVVFRNGRFAGIVGSATRLDGVSLVPLADALTGAKDALLAGALAREIDAARDGVIALNVAYATDGARITIAAGTQVALPIHLVFLADPSGPLAVTSRNIVEVGAGASVTLIESHAASGGQPLQANAVTQLSIGDGAEVSHVKVLTEGDGAIHVGTTIVDVGAEAVYRAFQLSAGIGLARNETALTYRGEGSRADVSGMGLGRGKDHIDTTLTIDHAVPGCESRELFKYVLDGEARGVFQGKVIVRPDAQKSDGKQMAQALMLSDTVEFDSKPELEIYADDVVCGHGSTVAEIDPDLVFYCRARGIPLDEARALLIDSFVGDALEKIEDQRIAEALSAIAQRWLRA